VYYFEIVACPPRPIKAFHAFNNQPAFIYGTVLKKDQTKRLVKDALKVGYRRVDTAAQPRHYEEALVGETLSEVFAEGILTREQLYVRINQCLY
jgi:diketogulonate reductase-like aldo/keto reductase